MTQNDLDSGSETLNPVGRGKPVGGVSSSFGNTGSTGGHCCRRFWSAIITNLPPIYDPLTLSQSIALPALDQRVTRFLVVSVRLAPRHLLSSAGESAADKAFRPRFVLRMGCPARGEVAQQDGYTSLQNET